MLSWAKRVEAQRAQSPIINSLTEAKEFDKLKVLTITHKDSPRRHTQTKTPTKQTCRYCGHSHLQRQCLAYGKTYTECCKIGHFRVVCRSRRARAMNEVEQEAVHIQQCWGKQHWLGEHKFSSFQWKLLCPKITSWYHIKYTQVVMVISCHCKYTKSCFLK